MHNSKMINEDKMGRRNHRYSETKDEKNIFFTLDKVFGSMTFTCSTTSKL